MPITIRRVPSADFRKATRLAELATKNEIESFSLEDDMESLYRSKIQTVSHPQLRLSTSSPILSNVYQSDEEQISPQAEEFDESGVSEYESCQDSLDEVDFDGDDEEVLDFEIEEAEAIAFTPAMAVAVPFQKASLVDISTLAPMAKRSVPISRPQSASYATFIRVKAPSPTDIRTSVFGSLMQRPVRNFSTPLPRSESLSPPESLHSGTSPSSSCLSLVTDPAELRSEAMIRGNSDEIQLRSTVLTGTEWDDTMLESPTPTSWAAYDPFALSAPTLIKQQQASYEDVYEKPKGWKRLGFTSKLLSAGKRSIRNY